MKYDVTVDYVTTASVFVEAANMDDAVELVSEYMRTPAGAEELLKMMAHNVPDGFDIPHVESAGENTTPPLLVAKPKFIHEVKDQWENHDDERRCPLCTARRMVRLRDGDDGYDMNGHWIASKFKCDACNGEWWATYYLGGAKLEVAE